MTDDNSVVITGGNSSAEFLAVLGFKVLFARHKNIGGWIKLKILRRPLLGQVVRHYKQALLTKPQAFAFLCRRNHFKCLAGTYHMSKQGIAAVKNMGDGVDLMGSQCDFGIDTHKVQMLAVILTGTHRIELLVIQLAKPVTSFLVFPYPVGKSVLYKLLFALCNGSFLFVQHRLFIAVFVLHIIKDTHITEV